MFLPWVSLANILIAFATFIELEVTFHELPKYPHLICTENKRHLGVNCLAPSNTYAEYTKYKRIQISKCDIKTMGITGR